MGSLGSAIRIGVRSDEGPSKLREEADWMVEGTDGVRELLKSPARLSRALRRLPQGDGDAQRRLRDAARHADRSSASPREDDRTVIYVMAGWWLLAVLIGVWMGREGGDLPADRQPAGRRAQSQTTLPEQNPGTDAAQPAVAAAHRDDRGDDRPLRRAAGRLGGGGLHDHLGAGVAPPGAGGAGDRGARRRALLRRSHVAALPDPADPDPRLQRDTICRPDDRSATHAAPRSWIVDAGRCRPKGDSGSATDLLLGGGRSGAARQHRGGAGVVGSVG